MTRTLDEVVVALCVYGAELDPDEVSRLLGATPTHSHARGDRNSVRKVFYSRGAWIREIRQFEPADPDEMFANLLSDLPQDSDVWVRLGARFEIQIDFALHTDAGATFVLSPRTVQLLADRKAAFQIYIQAYGADHA